MSIHWYCMFPKCMCTLYVRKTNERKFTFHSVYPSFMTANFTSLTSSPHDSNSFWLIVSLAEVHLNKVVTLLNAQPISIALSRCLSALNWWIMVNSRLKVNIARFQASRVTGPQIQKKNKDTLVREESDTKS